MSEPVIPASQNMYKDVGMRIPRYRYAKIPLNNITASNVSFQPTSSTLLEWKIPSQSCINMARSFICYQWAVPALANNYSISFENGFDFRSVYLGSGSGLGICDLQFADCYVNTVRAMRMKLQDFLTRDQQNGFYPCNQLNTSNVLPFSRDGLSAGTNNSSSTSYLEQQYINYPGAVNTALNLTRYVSLGDIKDTALGMDKDVVFGTDMYLRMQTQYLQRMGLQSTTPTNLNIVANNTSLSAAITVSNMYLYLAIEENLDIRKSLLDALAGGKIKMTIPYTYAYRFSNAGNSASANLSLTLTKNYGRGVNRILFVPYNAQEYTAHAYNRSNVNGTKVNQLQTSMDGRPNSDYILNCYNPNSAISPTNVGWSNPSNFSDDWREAQKFLVGNALCSYPQFQTNWFYADAWGLPQSNDLVNNSIPRENISDCFDLLNSGDHVYSFQATTAALTAATNDCYTNGLILYIFVTFKRTLIIQPDGISLEA